MYGSEVYDDQWVGPRRKQFVTQQLLSPCKSLSSLSSSQFLPINYSLFSHNNIINTFNSPPLLISHTYVCIFLLLELFTFPLPPNTIITPKIACPKLNLTLPKLLNPTKKKRERQSKSKIK